MRILNHLIIILAATIAYWLLLLLGIIVWGRIVRHTPEQWMQADDKTTAAFAGSIRISTVLAVLLGPPALFVALWLILT
jgi:hypothetical protein